MASIFTPCEGGVFAVKNETCRNSAVDSFVTIDDPEFGRTATVPVTGFDLELSTSQQFLHTLDKFIYVYSFGDRIGTCTFSGIGFTDCTDTVDGEPGGLYQYYIKNRLGAGTQPGNGKLTATKIRMPGGRILLGFLTGLKTSIPNPAYPIVQWVLQYNVIIGSQGGDASRDASGTYFAPGGPGGAGSFGPTTTGGQA
jgi:hypothetical protein